MNGGIRQGAGWLIVPFIMLLVITCTGAHADQPGTRSLFGYRGLNRIPDAYVTDGDVGFSYSHIPAQVTFQGNNTNPDNLSDNDIYTVSIGMFPFVECFLSVFVEPQHNINDKIPNYGANKSRLIGGKIRIVNESIWIPALSLCVFDPNLKKLGAQNSANNVSSTCLVASKRISRFGITAGYGDDQFRGALSRLNGWFGGMCLSITDHLACVIDYDAEFVSSGVQVSWKGLEAQGVASNGGSFSYRLGYFFNLMHEE